MRGPTGPTLVKSWRWLLAGVVLCSGAVALADPPPVPCAADACRSPVLPAAPWVVGEEAAPPSTASGAAGGSRSVGAPPSSGIWPGRLLVWSPDLDRQQVVLGRIDPDHNDDYLYRLPYADAASFPVIQGFGSKLSHRGAEYFTVDFGMDVGTPVYAARDGVVALFEDSHDAGCWHEECGRLANFVVLLHDDGTTGEYYHLQRGSVVVALGQHVRRGQLLARSGNTGYSNVPHLHFGVYRTEPDGHTQSVPIRFLTDAGIVDAPRTGARYLNPRPY